MDINSELGYICLHCQKIYKRKNCRDKHSVLCKFKHNKRDMIDNNSNCSNNASISDLYTIIVDLSLKYDKLQADYDLLSNYIKQKKRKINIIEWLNINCKPDISYNSWFDSIQLVNKHLEYIFDYDFVDGVLYILQEILNIENEGLPIKAFDHKDGILYIYEEYNDDDLQGGWHIMTGETFQKLIRNISLKLMALFKIWQDENSDKMENEKFAELYISNLKKVMGKTDYNTQYNKIRNKLYKYLKVSLKNIMYEFE